MSLSAHQRPHRGATDVWLTPPEILQAVGPFDLDPCAATNRPWDTAARHYVEADDGLAQPWEGLTWCNPPFGPEAARWLERCADHGNAVALVPARTETRWFVAQVWRRAGSVLFLASRPHFHYPNGNRAPFNSGAPICLVAYGAVAMTRLSHCELPGTLVYGWNVLRWWSGSATPPPPTTSPPPSAPPLSSPA